jgi:hypothetical protein
MIVGQGHADLGRSWAARRTRSWSETEARCRTTAKSVPGGRRDCPQGRSRLPCPLPHASAVKLDVTISAGRNEQGHHLAGTVGAALLNRLIDLRWVWRSPASRAVHVIDAGCTGLARAFGTVDASAPTS